MPTPVPVHDVGRAMPCGFPNRFGPSSVHGAAPAPGSPASAAADKVHALGRERLVDVASRVAAEKMSPGIARPEKVLRPGSKGMAAVRMAGDDADAGRRPGN